MSFGKFLEGVRDKLEKLFEKTASNAADHPDDGSQAFHDSRQAGEDTGSSAPDEANEEAENHDPAWKSVKDLTDKARDIVPNVEASAKHGWVKFVGAVTAIFTASIVFFSMQSPSMSPEQKSAIDTIHRSEDTRRQIAALNTIVLKREDWYLMMGGIQVSMAPTPTPNAAAPEATAAPIPIEAAPIPIEVAAVSTAPIEVDVETPTARRRRRPQGLPRSDQRRVP